VEIHALCTRKNDVVVGCADGSIAIVDVKNGRIIAKERVHDGEVRSVDALGPLLLSSGFDCSVIMSTVVAGSSSSSSTSSTSNNDNDDDDEKEATVKVVLARKDHTDKTLNARFHPHQAQAVSSSADKSVLVWDAAIF
jgi:WD40 repeat protein